MFVSPQKRFSLLMGILVVVASMQVTASPSRKNMGIYGGKVLDFAYDEVHGKLFAAVEGPLSLFTSSNYGKVWEQSFPDDSLEIIVSDHERYGWGGRGSSVVSNDGITIAITREEGGTLYSCAYSTDGTNWATLWDRRVARESNLKSFADIERYAQISTASTQAGNIFLASKNLILTSSDTAKTWKMLQFPDSLAFISTSDTSYDITKIVPIGTSSDSFYVVAKKIIKGGKEEPGYLFRSVGTKFKLVESFIPMDTTKLPSPAPLAKKTVDTLLPPPHMVVEDIIVNKNHPDTVFILEGNPQGGNPLGIYLSVDGCDTLKNILRAAPGVNLADLIVTQDSTIPGDSHIRLMCGVQYSDDLGKNWKKPASVNIGEIKGRVERLMLHIPNTKVYIGQSNDGPQVTEDGIDGIFSPRVNGMASLTVNKISQRLDQLNRVYLATASGLAFTSAYNDNSIPDSAKWQPPYGMFPITPDLALTMGAVTISPYDSLTVIAASGNGMYKTTDGGATLNGTNDDWGNHWKSVSFDKIPGMNTNGFKNNGGRVTDIVFYSKDTIFAALRAERNAKSGCLLESFDGGDSWQINKDLPEQATNAIEVAYDSTSKAKVIFVGTGLGGLEGRIYRSKDGGASWDTLTAVDAANNKSRARLPIRAIIAKPGTIDTIVFAGGDNTDWSIGYTYNGGDSIFALSGYAGGTEIISATVNKNHPDSIFFAQRNKIVVLDLSPTIDTTKPPADSIKPPPPQDSLNMPPPVLPKGPVVFDYFKGLPGEIFKDIHFDDLTMTSSVGFFNIPAGGSTEIFNHTVLIATSNDLFLKGIWRNRSIIGVRYNVKTASHVKLDLYNLSGRNIRTLVDGIYKPGIYSAMIPNNLASGVYMLNLKSGNMLLRKMMTVNK